MIIDVNATGQATIVLVNEDRKRLVQVLNMAIAEYDDRLSAGIGDERDAGVMEANKLYCSCLVKDLKEWWPDFPPEGD